MTLPKYQMVSGIYDIFNHICEQYFSGEDDNTSDYISEADALAAEIQPCGSEKSTGL